MARDTATFRGVQFYVEVGEVLGGRKTVVHSYPFRDQDFAEDLGRRGRVFQIDGYVIGDTYLADRDALIAALEQPGPGTLVHPYQGTRLVAVPQFRVRESRDDGRIASFSIDFLETPAEAFSPSIVAAPVAQVETAAAATHAASDSRLRASYRVSFPVSGAPGLPGVGATKSLPQFTFSSLTGLLSSFSTSLHAALRPVARTVEDAADFKRAMDALVLDAASLVRDPIALATRVGDVFQRLITFPKIPRLGADAFLTAYRFTSSTPRPGASTTTRQYEQANYDELDGFLRRAIVVEAARQLAIAANTFDTYEAAVAARDDVLDALDEQAQQASDDMYGVLMQLRADVATAVPAEPSALPRLVAHTPPATVPSMVLAYRLYGSVTLADDIVARNRVRHPGFVLGGRELQVLSHA